MNPRWIIVGEVRGPEALDLVRAFNTGHSGAGTIHANSAHDALLALEALILQSGIDVPARAVKEMVSRSIHIVVQVSQLPDHSRKVMEVAEVGGLDYEHSAGFPPYRLYFVPIRIVELR
jgi:pilus assembly protein CpaF